MTLCLWEASVSHQAQYRGNELVARLQLRSAAPHRRSRHRLALDTGSGMVLWCNDMYELSISTVAPQPFLGHGVRRG